MVMQLIILLKQECYSNGKHVLIIEEKKNICAGVVVCCIISFFFFLPNSPKSTVENSLCVSREGGVLCDKGLLPYSNSKTMLCLSLLACFYVILHSPAFVHHTAVTTTTKKLCTSPIVQHLLVELITHTLGDL